MIAHLLERALRGLGQAWCAHEWIERANWQGRYLQCAKCLTTSPGWQLRDDQDRVLALQPITRDGRR